MPCSTEPPTSADEAPPSRRTFLTQALISAGVLALAPIEVLGAPALLVPNVTGLYTVKVARIEAPTSAAAVAEAVKSWPGKVAVGGGRFSMGGQVAIEGGLHLDLRGLNQLVWLRAEQRAVRVQAGMRWRDLQDHLDPLNLSVKIMQSFANFSVGGSVSVNAHGRYVGLGPVGHSVRALQLVLADGSVAECSATLRPELFRAAIGGYGAIGVITEVELDLADNVRMERVIASVKLEDYARHFEQTVLPDADSILHNADLIPPQYDAPVSVTWRRTSKPLTKTTRLVPRHAKYSLEHGALWALTELPGAATMRRAATASAAVVKPAVRWRNHEASKDVAALEPKDRRITTYVLQEYFVPQRHFLGFARAIGATLKRHQVAAVNVSIRHSPADTVALLPWAREAVYSFVLYYQQKTHAKAVAEVERWTRELIDQALAHEGRYYLPYQLLATREQFAAAYPEAAALRKLKASVDPGAKFSNSLWARYLG
jgi:FAD/FMN-containing dehydrogenase